MSLLKPGALTAEDYDRLAREYQRTLPLEHYMESTTQSTQRAVTTASFDVLRALLDVTCYGELLVQVWHNGQLVRVVPDNLVVRGPNDGQPRTSFAIELEPSPPFMVLEYVSTSSEGKDYGDCFQKYEQTLRVPYCVHFHNETRQLTVYRHDGIEYVPVEANSRGRFEVPELELEIGLLRGWMRFWHQGKLLEIPAELQQRVDRQAKQIADQDKQLKQQDQQLKQQDKQLKQQADRIDRFEHERQEMLAFIREQVERKATFQGRRDILDRLAETDDLRQLRQWLLDLESA